MAWWNPKSWFQKTAPVLVEAPPVFSSQEETTHRWVEPTRIGLDDPEPEPLPFEEREPLEIVEPAPPPPVLEAPDSPFMWVEADPEYPHAGLSHFSDSPVRPAGRVLCVLGLMPEIARKEMIGRLIAWERLTPDQEAALIGPPYGFQIGLDDFRNLFR